MQSLRSDNIVTCQLVPTDEINIVLRGGESLRLKVAGRLVLQVGLEQIATPLFELGFDLPGGGAQCMGVHNSGKVRSKLGEDFAGVTLADIRHKRLGIKLGNGDRCKTTEIDVEGDVRNGFAGVAFAGY